MPGTPDRGGPGEAVRAGGGLVVRRRPAEDGWEVVLVHRPERADWSFPKGKVEPGETLVDAAVREVREETGFACRVGRYAGETAYRDRRGRPKVVAYWLMEPYDGRFVSGPEVDELRWAPVDDAAAVLTYEVDRRLLSGVLAAGLLAE